MKTPTKITPVSAARIIPASTRLSSASTATTRRCPCWRKLIADFPERQIRLLFGSGRNAINDKIGRLTRLVSEAQYDLLVITDGDIRVGPDYLRAVAHPFRDPKVGGATTLYVSTEETSFMQHLQSVGMISDFFAGIMAAWQLDGVKFMFGQSIVTTKQKIAGFGGYESIENRPADDLNVGRLVAEQAEVKLLPYIVKTVADFASLKDLFYKRVRWMTVMRLVRRQGHRGLVFTWGLIWALIAVAVHPTWSVAAAYLGTYMVLRVIITWLVGVYVMGQKGLWPKMFLIPLWDLVAFCIWVRALAGNDSLARLRLLHSRRNPGAGQSRQDAVREEVKNRFRVSSFRISFKFRNQFQVSSFRLPVSEASYQGTALAVPTRSPARLGLSPDDFEESRSLDCASSIAARSNSLRSG